MNFSNFTYKAVVDYLDVRITLRNPSNFAVVKECARVQWVDAVDKGPGGAATVFDVRIQDPRCYDDVDRMIKRLEGNLPGENGFSAPPVLARIEVAFDLYRRNPDIPSEVLACLVANMIEWHQYPVDDGKFRVYTELSEGHVLRRDRLVRLLLGGSTVCLGHPNTHAHYQRAYFKTTDEAGAIKLSEADSRARFENNYSGVALPVKSLPDLAQFKFEKLAKTGFSFRSLATMPQDQLVKMLAETFLIPVGRLGRRLTRSPRGKQVWVQRASNTKTVVPLNDGARHALQDLSKRWAA